MRPVVFVPGAWLGGWSWLPVAHRVADDGARVFTPTLPGLTMGDSLADLHLDDAVHALTDLLERHDLRDVVLVCHSRGGYPATGAAHLATDRVRKVVYYGAAVPAAGASMADENELHGGLIREAVAADPAHGVPIDFASARDVLMNGETPETQRLVFDLLVPQPGGYMVDPSKVGPVTEIGIEATYVLGEQDHALARPGAEFAARLDLEPIMVPGSHMFMLTHPDAIAPAIVAACR